MKLIPESPGEALRRSALGSVIVIMSTAAVVAVAGLLGFKQLAKEIGVQPALKASVAIPQPGQAQTLFLIGSDHRAGEPYRDANTDTMMLMRIDPRSTTINVLSVPRDLEVQIPDGGTMVIDRLNSAYSRTGGADGILQILKTQVFPGFHVNHVIDVNFAGFSDLIDAIGCVYTNVDHRYYNLSAPGPNNYSSIDIQPGYQRLCGDNQSDSGALAFVRFRHTDSDIVRNARQQDFLRWAKQNYTGLQLFENRDRLVSILGEHSQTDYTLHSADAIENLVILLASAAGHQLKSIPFPATFTQCNGGTGQTPCYVTSTPSQEAAAYRSFMTPTLPAAKPKPTVAAPGRVPDRPVNHGAASAAGLVADVADGQQQASALKTAGLSIYYPRLIQGPSAESSAGSQYCSNISDNCDDPLEPAAQYTGSYPRQYAIRGPDGGHDHGRALIARGHQREHQVGGLRVERDVADFVADD